MFTGIIDEMGRIAEIRHLVDAVELRVECAQTIADVKLGDSIAVDGVCLTVTAFDAQSFTALVSAETLRRTSLGERVAGDWVNLENPVSLSKQLGGHMVLGHVDGTAEVECVTDDGECQMWQYKADAQLLKFLVWKGSVSIDGISLTVVDVATERFSVTIIPKTLHATNMQHKKVGDKVNIEVDIIGKYVWRFMHPDEEMTLGGTLTQA
ncbi:MAG: riboflavin synthase [Candidatus Sumerlaeales bacterium]|nr:riboflavin synthase [Candidatus Sumerlaeales bacterium]